MAIDPFLHDLVLQHFKATEVLTVISFVSPEWSQIAGKSRQCMGKIKFQYQVWRHQFYSSTEVFQCAQNSWRDYQHVTVELGVNDDCKQFWKLIESCCSSIKSLKIENIRWNSAVAETAIEFSNLESFTAYGNDDETITTILGSTNQLKNLFIFSSESSITSEAIECLRMCLQRNKKLTELYLKNLNFLNIFATNLNVSFNLKSFKFMNTSSRNSMTSNVEDNLLNFLKQQSSSLKTFFFEFSSKKITEFAFNCMPVLTSIGLLDKPISSLKRNELIVNLEIPQIDGYSDIKAYVDATPNVESLFVGEVSSTLVDHLAWNFMKLESLNFKMIGFDVEDHYEQLKNDYPDINQDIEIWDYENVDWD